MNINIDRKSSLIGDDIDDYSIAIQYRLAYKTLLMSNVSIDSIALPILYLIVHYLELLLKVNIKYFSQYSGSNYFLKKINSTHDLVSLQSAFFQHYDLTANKIDIKISQEEIDITKNALSKLINILCKIDQSSQSFRYVYDKNEKRQFDEPKYVNFNELLSLLKEGEKILLYSIDIFEMKEE